MDLPDRECVFCGTRFKPKRKNHKFCRDRCRKDAYDERKYRERVERMTRRAMEVFEETMRAVIEEEFRR